MLRTLSSRQGEPYHPGALQADRRRLDALRLFSSIDIQPIAAGDEVIEVDIERDATSPAVRRGVGDRRERCERRNEDSAASTCSAGGSLSSATMQFGGATTVGARVQRPTVTPGTWDFDTSVWYTARAGTSCSRSTRHPPRPCRPSAGWNWTSRVQVGGRAEYMSFDTGGSDLALSPDGTDHLPLAVGDLAALQLSGLPIEPAARAGSASIDAGRPVRRRELMDTDDGRAPLAAAGRTVHAVAGRVPLGVAVRGRRTGPAGISATSAWAERTPCEAGPGIPRWQEPGNRDGRVPLLADAGPIVHRVWPDPTGGVQAAAYGDVGVAWTERFSGSDAIDGYGVGLRLLVPVHRRHAAGPGLGEPGGGSRLLLAIKLKADKQRDRVR